MTDSKSLSFSVRNSSDEDQQLRQLAAAWNVKRSMAIRLLIQHTMNTATFTPIGFFTPVGTDRLEPVRIGGGHESH